MDAMLGRFAINVSQAAFHQLGAAASEERAWGAARKDLSVEALHVGSCTEVSSMGFLGAHQVRGLPTELCPCNWNGDCSNRLSTSMAMAKRYV
jgi:hypothetical protein